MGTGTVSNGQPPSLLDQIRAELDALERELDEMEVGFGLDEPRPRLVLIHGGVPAATDA